MRYFKLKLNENWPLIVISALAVFFFTATSQYNHGTQSYGRKGVTGIESLDFVKWGSPDETANYIFAKLYAQGGGLTIREDLNLYVKDIMLPRSFRSDNGVLKPVSFLGIILVYGELGRVFGYHIIPYLTPLFASLGLIFFFLLLKKIFNQNIALISAFLLSAFPPYVYYTARSMFHNVLFVVFAIMALYFSSFLAEDKGTGRSFLDFKLGATERKGLILAALAGLFWGLAAITRTSELLWLAPLIFFLWLFNFTRISLIKISIFLGCLFLALLPIFYYNQILYGSPLKGGYNEMNQSISKISQASTELVEKVGGKKSVPGVNLVKTVLNVVFHFGVHPRTSLLMAEKYFAKMFAWLFWLGMLGILLFLLRYKKIRKRKLTFLFAWLLSSFILILYYGSWEFHDNPDPNLFTIGNSYTRYWLPVYLGAVPFASLAIVRLSRGLVSFLRFPRSIDQLNLFLKQFRIRRSFLVACLQITAVAAIMFLSLNFVLIGSDEGLVQSASRQKQSRNEWMRILQLTEGNSAIISTYHDKLMFPERKVIVGLFTDLNMVNEYAKLARLLPLYYYNFSLSEKDLDYLNNSRLRSVGLQIKKVEKLTTDFTLYRLYYLSQT